MNTLRRSFVISGSSCREKRACISQVLPNANFSNKKGDKGFDCGLGRLFYENLLNSTKKTAAKSKGFLSWETNLVQVFMDKIFFIF